MDRFPFKNRYDAGRQLATKLMRYSSQDTVVLALPRGGVPVGFEVAEQLHAPLDVFLVRKLGVPFQPELAFGAIASGGIQILNDDVVREAHLTHSEIREVTKLERIELERREKLYRGDSEAVPIEGRVAIIVDDGLATGASMAAALAAAKLKHPAKLIGAVPVCAEESCERIKSFADEVVCALIPDRFYSVGMWYDDFSETTDDEVRGLLAKSADAMTVGGAA